MMKFLGILALYQVAYGRLMFMDSKMKQPDPFDMFSNLLNDIHFDISFNEPKSSMWGNDNMNMDAQNDFFIDDSPSSMLDFPSFPSFSLFNSPIDSMPSQDMSFRKPSKPLYLLIERLPSVQAMPKPMSSSMFILDETNKVNGNTWRYTVRSNGNDENMIVTESWSTPKMYLCNKPSCGRHAGIEMMNVFNDFRNDFGSKYMHLVPSTTVEPMDEGIVIEDEYNANPYSDNWMGNMGNMMRGCHNRVKDWYYGDDTVTDTVVMNDMVLLDDTDELMDESVVQQQSDDLMLSAMSVIMMLIAVWGVLYVGWRLLSHRKQKSTMDFYVAMDNDKF